MTPEPEENRISRCACCLDNFACPSNEVFDDICPACRAILVHGTTIEEPPPPPRSKFIYRPGAVEIIVLLNLIVFACMGFPNDSLDSDTLIKWGAEWGPLTFGQEWWRTFTSIFIHEGIGHIFSNLTVLALVAWPIARVFDKWTFLFSYIVCGLWGEIAMLTLHPELVSFGASGAVFGIVG